MCKSLMLSRGYLHLLVQADMKGVENKVKNVQEKKVKKKVLRVPDFSELCVCTLGIQRTFPV